ncbi:DUF3459 domain-containing protein [Nonomuraea angiospora]|uniref:Glycosidase n=1 Tax=Nonomuraea angiospora TaxID=46172 RepID=A0ABR9LUV1_9ACTN|nr:DUF3459 domain-containing protein [Nonomuraea angiospora]MBE1584053.1 glycosidase [Nonomuraea angiospora]
MPWETTPSHAGFTPDDVEPWLPIPAWAGQLSVESQELDPRSPLSRVRELLKLRRELAALRQGDITVLSAHPDHLAYLRGDGGDSLVVAVNLSGRDQRVAFPGVRSTLWSSSFTGGERDRLPGEVTLAPFEARVLR